MTTAEKTIRKTSMDITLPIITMKGDEIEMEVDYISFRIDFKRFFERYTGPVIEIQDIVPTYAQDTNGHQLMISQIASFLEDKGIEEIIQEKATDHLLEEYPEHMIKFAY